MNLIHKISALITSAALALVIGITTASAIDKVTVAYFLEWPTANQVAQLEKTYDEEMGVELEWRAFGNGNEMTQAMVSGDVQIAYSQGFVPFVVGVTNDAPLTLVGIAVTYSDNDSCVIRSDAGITQENAKELEGKKVATPIGNVTHYKFLKTMEHLGVDSSKIELVQMDPPDGAIALVRGDVTMACGFGAALDRMETVGFRLMTGAEQEAVGIGSFDIISVTNDFAKDHPDLVKTFIKVTEEANNAYKNDPDSAYPTIAKAAGMDLNATKDTMGGFGFPSVKDQLGANWLGGAVQETALGVAEVMAATGNLENPLSNYSKFVDDSFLK